MLALKLRINLKIAISLVPSIKLKVKLLLLIVNYLQDATLIKFSFNGKNSDRGAKLILYIVKLLAIWRIYF